MKLLPIEAGCRALFRPHPSWGTPDHDVTVMSKHPIDDVVCWWCGSVEQWWRIDTTRFGPRPMISCTCRLTRIDGNPDQEREVVKDLEVCV